MPAGGVGASSCQRHKRQQCLRCITGHRSPSPPPRRNDLALEFGAVSVSATPRNRIVSMIFIVDIIANEVGVRKVGMAGRLRSQYVSIR